MCIPKSLSGEFSNTRELWADKTVSAIPFWRELTGAKSVPQHVELLCFTAFQPYSNRLKKVMLALSKSYSIKTYEQAVYKGEQWQRGIPRITQFARLVYFVLTVMCSTVASSVRGENAYN